MMRSHFTSVKNKTQKVAHAVTLPLLSLIFRFISGQVMKGYLLNLLSWGFLIGLASTFTVAQSLIKGNITDTFGQPVSGVNIYILDSYDGGASAADGSYFFTTDLNGVQILVASAVGYIPFQQSIDLDQEDLAMDVILEQETKQLEDLVITAGVFDASDEKKSVILKPLDIVTTAGATADIPGVLNTLPGTQTVGETGRLFVRGGADNETKNYIDGMMVSQPYGFTPSNIPSRMRFSPFLFSGTTFSTGGYSAEFGQALSGTLNLRTDNEALQTQTDLSFMSVGGGLSHTQQWNKNSIFLETFYTDLTPYFWLVPQNTDWERAPMSWQSTFMFRQKIGKQGNLKVFYNGEWSRMQLNQPSRMDVTEKAEVDLTNQYHYLNANYQGIISKYWMVNTGISNTWSDERADLESFSTMNKLTNLHFKFTTLFDKGKAANLKFGTDIFRYTYHLQAGPSIDEDIPDNQVSEVIPALYLESSIHFSDKFIGVVGGRLEYASIGKRSILSPRISLAYKTGSHSQLSFASGLYHQRPGTQYLVYNKILQDERAIHYILNYQYSNNNRTFRAEVYFKDYKRLVRYLNPDLGTFDNLNNEGYGYAGGLDIFWRDSHTFRNVDYWISYSFLDTKRWYRDYPVESMPYFASKHNFSLVYKHFIQFIRSQIGATYSFASARPYHDPNSEHFNSGRTPAYHDLSVNLSYMVRTNFIIHFSVTNVLGRDHIFGYQYSLVPDTEGNYAGIPVDLPAKRFIFLGVFITLSKDNASNQLRNL